MKSQYWTCMSNYNHWFVFLAVVFLDWFSRTVETFSHTISMHLLQKTSALHWFHKSLDSNSTLEILNVWRIHVFFILSYLCYLISIALSFLLSSPMVQFQLLHSKFALCSSATRGLLMSTYVKFINLFPEIKGHIQEVSQFLSTLLLVQNFKAITPELGDMLSYIWRGVWNKALSDVWCNVKFS